MSSAAVGTVTPIFTTGDMDFRGQAIFVAYVVLECPSSAALGSVSWFSLGGNVTHDDWTDGAPDLTGQFSGVVLFPNMATGKIPMILYGPGIVFSVRNQSTSAQNLLGQWSAYGWSYG